LSNQPLETVTVPLKTVTANNIASRLLCVSKAPTDKNYPRATKTSIRGSKSTLTNDTSLSSNFNLNELESALKSGTTAGFDGVFMLISFMNDVLSSARLPKLFKRAKVIAIPKPGKYGSVPAHYRPSSLLSVMYKLLKRLILQRIQPQIEAATPIHQAGFRKHGSCTEQVMVLTETGVVFVDLSAAYDSVWGDGLTG
jgi:hypothetical protein